MIAICLSNIPLLNAAIELVDLPLPTSFTWNDASHAATMIFSLGSSPCLGELPPDCGQRENGMALLGPGHDFSSCFLSGYCYLLIVTAFYYPCHDPH